MGNEVKIVFNDGNVLHDEMTSEISSHLYKLDDLYPSGLADLSFREKEKLVQFIYKSLTNKYLEDITSINYFQTGPYIFSLYEKRNISDGSKIGTEYLNRTIYYKNNDGLTTVHALAGSYLSKEMMKEALELEERYTDLNNEVRKKVEKLPFPYNRWKLKSIQQDKLKIK